MFLHSHSDGWQRLPTGHPLQSGVPLASSLHAHEHVSGSRSWVDGQAWVRSHVHAQLSVSNTKPGAHDTASSQTHAHACGSQVSLAAQPPQPARHSTAHVAGLQKNPSSIAPTLQSSAHSHAHVSTFQSKPGPGGCVVGVGLHSHAHVPLQKKSALGCGVPQSPGHSQRQSSTLHTELPAHPPQSAGQKYSHVPRSQTALGPGARASPQSAGHAQSHAMSSHTKSARGGMEPGGGAAHV